MLLRHFNFSDVGILKYIRNRFSILLIDRMNFQYSQSSASTLQQYIEDGLPRDIISRNQECYAIMRFVDYDDVAKEVTLLIAGEDPQMHSTISRDFLIDWFVWVFVRPLLLHQFLDLRTVKYLKTTDDEYDRAVIILGVRVKYSDLWLSLQLLRLYEAVVG